jgi:nicotinamide-nucleotide amidase
MSAAPAWAEIIAVGSELLTAHRSDTNSLYLTSRLNDAGIRVSAKHVIGDDRVALRMEIADALSRANLVIVTGGLGPTADDVTRDAVSDALGRSLRDDDGALAAIRARFAARGLPMPSINYRQARIIEGATLLPNAHGTAPGQWIDDGDRAIVLLPGPPRELQPMFEAHVLPRLTGRGDAPRVHRRVIRIAGRSESAVDEIAQPIYGPWAHEPLPIETTILAVSGEIELHLTAAGAGGAAVDHALDEAVRALATALVPAVFSTDGRTLEQVVGDALRARGLWFAAAESCTGGLLLGRLTEVPGSSAYIVGGVVAYADAVKVDTLGVPSAMIATHGAVSEPVATAMAEGAVRRFGADVALSITGIAGPDGGSADKPVGTVVIAVAGPAVVPVVRTHRFLGDRQLIRRLSTTAALDLVRRLLA